MDGRKMKRGAGLLAAACAAWMLDAPARGATEPAATAQEEGPAVASPVQTLPAYRHPYKDGLYSTIVAMISVGAPEIKNQAKMKLKVPGFKKDFQVRAILQKHAAPLVIVLVGVDGLADTPLGRLFPYWLNEAGFNVLTFDSTFRPSFEDASRFGVTGNLPGECEQIGKVVAEFLKQDEVKKKVTKVGVAGYSLGGTQALVLARLAGDGKLPFTLDSVLALSPIIKLQRTAAILDDFYTTDRWKYTMIDMAKEFMTHEPVAPGAPIPFKPEFMRAGIGYVIREEFTDIVDKNDDIFRLNLLPDSNGESNRRSEAEAWGFVRFMERMSFPYWQAKGAVKSVDDLWRGGDMLALVSKLPASTRAVTCEDDPLNAPEDLAEFRKAADPKNLVVHPLGGHLGYLGTAWCYHALTRMFEQK